MDEKYFERDCTHIKTSPFGIFTDQAGYYTKSVKLAVLPFACDDFTVTDSSGSVVFSGKTEHFGFDENSGDDVYTADLTLLETKGRYRVCAGGKTSAEFYISDAPYSVLLHDITKAFYFLRCGCGLDEEYAGVYKHGCCHDTMALLWDDNSVSLDVTGGWHDAGDYGRYVTAGACAAAHLLYAYKMFPVVFDKLTIDIPKSDMPDLLTEVRYELEWLLKMQREDGGVFHKVTTKRHAPFVMPEDDKEQLYVFSVSTMAAADFAAVCALASGVYEAFDKYFAKKLRTAAEKAGRFLDDHPEFIGFVNPEGCNTGSYGQWNDNSNRYWAYAELYALTGDNDYFEKMRSLGSKGFPLTALGYAETGGLGSLAYILSSQNKDDKFAEMLKNSFKEHAADLRQTADKCGYSAAMDKRSYHWGSNMTLLCNAMIFAIDDLINGDKDDLRYAEAQLHCLLGCNALGISYVTGCGEYRCNYPHLRPAFADGIEECIPGMVAGGPNRFPADPFAKEVIAEGTPPMKCYADDTASYSLNEITIYWNSPAVFLLGYICGRHANGDKK